MHMMNAFVPDTSVQRTKRRLPLAVPVPVQCEGFRCLAYRNKEGKWLNYHSGKPLPGNVRVVEYNRE